MSKLEKLLIEKLIDTKNTYNLWENDEPLVIGISGGKDSLSLYSILKKLHKNLFPVHINNNPDQPQTFSFQNEIATIDTNIYNTAHDPSQKKNPCFICSRLRRRALLEYAQKINAKTILLAHNKNDVNETLLLNILFSREISTLMIKQEVFRGQFHIVRPFFEIEDSLIRAYSKEQKFIIKTNDCPENNSSKRTYIRNLLKEIQSDHPKIDLCDNIFSSLKHIKSAFLPFDIQNEK
jgi:tRNA 2-thiocytidine biosynthesis protein TtcA